jgi:hypothetical protein
VLGECRLHMFVGVMVEFSTNDWVTYPHIRFKASTRPKYQPLFNFYDRDDYRSTWHSYITSAQKAGDIDPPFASNVTKLVEVGFVLPVTRQITFGSQQLRAGLPSRPSGIFQAILPQGRAWAQTVVSQLTEWSRSSAMRRSVYVR